MGRNLQPVLWIHPDYIDNFNSNGSYEILAPPSNALRPITLPMLQQLQQNMDSANSLGTETERDEAYNNAINNFNESLVLTNPTPNPNPDEGEDSGSTDTENNSSFLADLSHLFPFCIPFDLINCVKLLTAERETPCVEVPMHFKFVDVDYTWVIDLEDFNGVASVCRTMFLLLYIVGLVMVTRPLIRG